MSDPHPVPVALENRLMSHGIYLTACDLLPASGSGTADRSPSDFPIPMPDGTGLALEYETTVSRSNVGSDEVGAVVRTVLAIADERDWRPGRIEVTSMTLDGIVRGRWHVDGTWFEALGEDLDELAFSQRVLETRHHPDDE